VRASPRVSPPDHCACRSKRVDCDGYATKAERHSGSLQFSRWEGSGATEKGRRHAPLFLPAGDNVSAIALLFHFWMISTQARSLCAPPSGRPHGRHWQGRGSPEGDNLATIHAEDLLGLARGGMQMSDQEDERGQPRVDRAAIEDCSSLPRHLTFDRRPQVLVRRVSGNRSRARPDVYVATARRWRGRV
jgi:hypothetical protein